VTIHGVWADNRLYWTLTQLVTANNCNAHTNLHALQFTVAHTKPSQSIVSSLAASNYPTQTYRIANTGSRRISPLVHDVLSELLHSNGPGILMLECVYGCRGKVFTSRCLAMEDFFVKLFRFLAVMSHYFRFFSYLPGEHRISVANICGLITLREIISVCSENQTSSKNSRWKTYVIQRSVQRYILLPFPYKWPYTPVYGEQYKVWDM
jgi:hypothetical protein